MIDPSSPSDSDSGASSTTQPACSDVRCDAVPHWPVVGVGASAGGLEAFSQLLQNLPPHPGFALVLVQHLDPRHDSLLSTILSQTTSLPVSEATNGVLVEEDHIYILPPNKQMTLVEGRLVLQPRSIQSVPHMPVDIFFRSLAQDAGTRAVGVVLSGGGSDGTLGLAAIKAAGGITFAQEESTAGQSSMPRSAIIGGGVDFILPPDQIARELVRYRSHDYLKLPPESPTETIVPPEERVLSAIFALLRNRNGVDFVHYKHATIHRRIQRRMALLGLSDPDALLRRLEDDPAEVDALFQDLLLRVTSFFRDPAVFDALQQTVFPAVLKDLAPEGVLRVWVPGCSTGEEAYSIAMALIESLGEKSCQIPIKILATDVNEAVLARARAGCYPENIVQDVSPERLLRFFHKQGDQYRISKAVRDLCVFSRHNLFLDAPFARLHLISCRNVLIYLDTLLQRRIFPLFHYALRPGGFLLLGTSESVGAFTDLFDVVDRTNCLYVRTMAPTRTLMDRATRPGEETPMATLLPTVVPGEEVSSPDLLREADRLLARYAPPGVLLDDNLNILHFRGDTSPYLRNPPGTAHLNILRMANEGLLADLRDAIHSARETNSMVHREGILVNPRGEGLTLRLTVIPLPAGRSTSRCLLVLFEDQAQGLSARVRAFPADFTLSPEETDERITLLRRELEANRENLQTIIEAHEATNEELKSANEEILASNEELQSTNEELQTAQEEMHSSNEELQTTNEELHHRIEEVSKINDDLTNLLAAASISIVMVSRDLCIRRFTAQAEKLFNLIPTDVGRPIRNLRFELDCPHLDQLLTHVIDTLQEETVEVRDHAGRYYSLRVRPYQTAENKIDGAVITVIDIDAIRRGELALRASRDFVARILDTMHEALVVLDDQNCVQRANRSFYRTFQILPEEVDSLPFFSVKQGQWDLPELRTLIDQARTGVDASSEMELDIIFPRLGHLILRVLARPVPGLGGIDSLTLLSIEDVTEQRRIQKSRHDLEVQMYQAQKLESLGILAGGIAHDLNNILTPVLGFAELARLSLPVDSSAIPMLTAVETAARTAADLVQQILAYAGKGKFVIQIFDLSQTLREMEGLLRATISKQARLHLELSPQPVPIEADPTQIRQIILNLLTNASEALDSRGGSITIRTGQIDLDSEMREYLPAACSLPPGNYVYLEVQDTGCGMNSATLEKVFDPFFTTKFTGRGLGLAAALGIAQGHRGSIQVQSEPGHGSTFRLLLPRSSTPVSVQKPLASIDDWKGSGEVLVVDDEPGVRTIAASYLQHSGFSVLQAGDGSTGVAMFEKHQADIVAVLLDLTMPHMSGIEMAEVLQRIRPEVPLILMSGYSVTEVTARYEGKGIAAFLQKPFNHSNLLGAMRQALEQ